MPHKAHKQNSVPFKTKQAQPVPYIAACAAGLVRYAKENAQFGILFREMIHETLPPEMFSEDAFHPRANLHIHNDLLLPKDKESAERRAIWLMNTGERFPGADMAARILISYAGQQTQETPKQIVIGIKVGVIPGVTLGQIKVKRFMSVIIRKDLEKEFHQQDISRRGTQACLSVVARSLEAAGGDARDLEPDTFDWFFGEKDIHYYTAGHSDLERIQTDLRHINAPHAHIHKDGEVIGLAIGPAVDADTHSADWGLKTLEE